MPLIYSVSFPERCGMRLCWKTPYVGAKSVEMTTVQHCVQRNPSLIGCRLWLVACIGLSHASSSIFKGNEGSFQIFEGTDFLLRISWEWKVLRRSSFHYWSPCLTAFTNRQITGYVGVLATFTQKPTRIIVSIDPEFY